MVSVPRAQLDAIEEELSFLRERVAAWDDTAAAASLEQVGGDLLATECGWDAGVDCGCLAEGCGAGLTGCCDGCGASCCSGGLCYSCLCPTPEAPCVDCPRVTTLRPYSNIRIYGALKTDMLFSEARPLAAGTPFFLSPGSALDQSTFDLHARQSTLAAAFTGPVIGGMQSSGVIVGLFYDDAVIVDQYGFLPLQAWGELRNEKWRFAGGRMFDVFAPGLPTVLPFSALAASGNAGNSFRGQLRVERYFVRSTEKQWTVQAAVSEPINTAIDPTFGLSEDNGFPNVEARVALGLGALQGAGPLAKRPFELGVSGLYGQIRTTPLPPDPRVVTDVWGVAADGRWRMSESFGVAGEFYHGQTLGSYNGGILQNVNPATLEGVRSTGGWLEAYVYWTPCVHTHFGYAIDDPLDSDVSVDPLDLGRLENSTYFANAIWDVNKTFRVAFEFSWRETDYAVLADNDGAGFHTQFQWSF